MRTPKKNDASSSGDAGVVNSAHYEFGPDNSAYFKAKLSEISSDTHQLHYTPKHHFII